MGLKDILCKDSSVVENEADERYVRGTSMCVISRYLSSYSKAFNVTHVAKWENGKVVKSEMS